MKTTKAGYIIFEREIHAALQSLRVPPHEVTSGVIYMEMPAFSAPVEFFEVQAHFPGASCVLLLGETVTDRGYFCEVELRRDGEETLFLSDYLTSHDDNRQEFMTFREEEMSLEEGIARMVNIVVALLNEDLLPVLEGQAWVTAPFDWGDYK